jgi:hypothetical protein
LYLCCRYIVCPLVWVCCVARLGQNGPQALEFFSAGKGTPDAKRLRLVSSYCFAIAYLLQPQHDSQLDSSSRCAHALVEYGGTCHLYSARALAHLLLLSSWEMLW